MTNLQKQFGFPELNADMKEIYDELDFREQNYKQWISDDKSESIFNRKLSGFSSELLYQTGFLQALLFGYDNRREVVNFCDPDLRNQLLNLACGIAGVVKREQLQYQSGGNYYKLLEVPLTLKQRFERDKGIRLIDKTPFLLQPSIMTGTAFLVGKDLVLTAGHVVNDRNTSEDSIGLSFIFNFKYDEDYNVNSQSFLNFNVYHGKKILHKREDLEGDWALIKLDREVSGYQQIPLVHFDYDYKQEVSVSGIGHPLGLPMKYTDDAVITKVGDHFIESSLDTFWGNSGSPVLAVRDGEFGVIGIMSSTSGRYVPASDHCLMYRPQQFYDDSDVLNMRCQKINNEIKQLINLNL